MSLLTYLAIVSEKELRRCLKSGKSYLDIRISVFNAGTVVRVICTDRYRERNANTWNGYDFIIENDDVTKYYISQVLKELNSK